MTNVDSKLESAARLERSSFFVAEKAVAKIAGVEGGNCCHKKQQLAIRRMSKAAQIIIPVNSNLSNYKLLKIIVKKFSNTCGAK